jgi:uncharacterized protein YdbL (DUF1318 family)
LGERILRLLQAFVYRISEVGLLAEDCMALCTNRAKSKGKVKETLEKGI